MRRRALEPTRITLAFGLAFLFASFLGCSSKSNREIAEAAVEKFHSQFNSESYDSILLGAAPEFKAGGEKTKAYLEKARDLLGKVKSSNQAVGSVQNMETEAQINLTYMTDFAEGQAAETFVFRVKDKRATLVHYEVGFQDISDF